MMIQPVTPDSVGTEALQQKAVTDFCHMFYKFFLTGMIPEQDNSFFGTNSIYKSFWVDAVADTMAKHDACGLAAMVDKSLQSKMASPYSLSDTPHEGTLGKFYDVKL